MQVNLIYSKLAFLYKKSTVHTRCSLMNSAKEKKTAESYFQFN